MNFDPINWKAYNKPPYLPQWLSIGDTKKLVSFADEKYIEIEKMLYDLSNQWDLEKAKARLLDRIGKIVDELRDGNEDKLYRLLVKLRILLNTTNGTVNDIIKVIKFLYSSEVVKITPNYPAALTILHDGEQEYIDFNRILVQVIGAGIGYETRELFIFRERMVISECPPKIHFVKDDIDCFVGPALHYDNTYRYDGTICYNSGGMEDYLVVKTTLPPMAENIRMKDKLAYGYRRSLYYDNSHSYDGEICYNSDDYISLNEG